MKYLDDLETILLKDLVPDQKLENCFWVKSDSQLRSDEFFHDLNQKDQERIFSLIETIIHTERHGHFAGALNSFNLSSNWTFFIEQRWEGAWFILGAVKGGFEDTACPSFIKKFYANQLGFLDKNIFDILNLKSPFLQKAIYESCKIKKLVVEKDEKEKNFRKILNFGHTFAHAYEASLNYSKKLNHGEAVLLGISTAIDFSHKKNFLKNNDYKKINYHIHNSKLPFDLKNFLQKKHLNKILNFMEKDKKNKSKKINLILLKNIGQAILNKEYDRNIIKSFLKKKFN